MACIVTRRALATISSRLARAGSDNELLAGHSKIQFNGNGGLANYIGFTHSTLSSIRSP
jgi:hypothetical protein